MSEKDMVLDILTGLKAGIASYAGLITECNDENLRQTFIQLRNADETSQYELYKIAKKKGYYTTPKDATDEQKQELKAKLTESLTIKNGAGPKLVLS